MTVPSRTIRLFLGAFLGAVTTAAAFPDDGEHRPYLFSASAIIERIECYQCVKWPGSNLTTRVADVLIVTVVSPSEHSGRQIKLFVWNDNGKSQIWLPDSRVSFPAFARMMDRDRAVFPLSETTFAAN